MHIQDIYYNIKPLIPRRLQIALRRRYVINKRCFCGEVWPINEEAGKLPEGFAGWPEQKQFALVLTHDVDTVHGQEKCHNLISLEEEAGFKSFFSFVPERYNVSPELRQYLVDKGFEVAVHGLHHDGKLFKNKDIFDEQALKINDYLKAWNAVGFRAPSMHCNLEWIHALNIEYDSSTFDTDPFEPYNTGIGTIFPFWKSSQGKGYVEMPYTLPQDFTLFILMREKNIGIWKGKLDWIAEKGGMALLNTHPDYMNFGGNKPGLEEYPAKLYADFLNYVKEQYKDRYWHVLPRDMARFFTTNLRIKIK